MGYRYPNGATNPDQMIADIVATVSYIDFVLGLALTHMHFPIDMNARQDEVDDALFQKFKKFNSDVIEKMSYREKINMFFALVDIPTVKTDKGNPITRKQFKTMLIALGEQRNTIAHNAAVSLLISEGRSRPGTVAAAILDDPYDTFQRFYELVAPLIESIENEFWAHEKDGEPEE